MPNKLTPKQKLTGIALTGMAGIAALTASQIENGKPEPARVEISASPNTEPTTPTTAEKAKPVAKTVVKAVIPTTTTTTEAPTTTTTLPKPPETTTTSTVVEKAPEAWQLTALAMANPQVGQEVTWTEAKLIIKPGAKLFSAPSTFAEQLEIADESPEIKLMAERPMVYQDENGIFVCMRGLNKGDSLICSNDFDNMRTIGEKGQEVPFYSDSMGLATASGTISSINEQGQAFVNDLPGQPGNLVGQRVDGFVELP